MRSVVSHHLFVAVVCSGLILASSRAQAEDEPAPQGDVGRESPEDAQAGGESAPDADAEEESSDDVGEERLPKGETRTVEEEQKKDDTGTDPTNFTFDFRLTFEHQRLSGGSSNNIILIEQRIPTPGIEKWLQLRIKLPLSQTVSTTDGQTASGFGDLSARALTVPYRSEVFAVAFGLEYFGATASATLPGVDRHSLGPQVFLGAFFKMGQRATGLFIPGYQYRFSVGGSGAKVNQSVMDFYFVALPKSKKFWLLVDPQLILDHEIKKNTFLAEIELGRTMFGPISATFRPGFHIAGEKLYTWNIEAGIRVIWR